jgi:hypothetical protein
MTNRRSLFAYRLPPEPRSLETITTDSRGARERSQLLRADAVRVVHYSRILRTSGRALLSPQRKVQAA